MTKLRSMTEQDVNQCIELYISAFNTIDTLHEMYRRALPRYFRKFISDKNAYAYVLCENDTVIGILTAIQIPNLLEEYSIHIDTVAIAPEFQHRGFGREMLTRFIASNNRSTITITATRKSNGYQLYDKVGFYDVSDCAYMMLVPGVTEKLKQINEQYKQAIKEKEDLKKHCQQLQEELNNNV